MQDGFMSCDGVCGGWITCDGEQMEMGVENKGSRFARVQRLLMALLLWFGRMAIYIGKMGVGKAFKIIT